MDGTTDTKRRPPPILVPPPPLPRQLPGPNAFAAAKARQDEIDKQHEVNASAHEGKRSATQNPVVSPLNGPHLPGPDECHPKGGPERGSFMATMASIARGSLSPRKSESRSRSHVSTSTSSYHGSTTRSRHSNRSQRSAQAYPLVFDEGRESYTVRGELESQSTKTRPYQMEAPEPVVPVSTNERRHYKTYDLTEQCKEAETSKSPKKKIFGMSLPTVNISSKSLANFKSSTKSGDPPLALPEMPSKAAKVLGATPVYKQHNSPHPTRTTAPRSDTSKSLPSKLKYDQHGHRRGHPNASVRGHRQHASRKTSSISKPREQVTRPAIADDAFPPTPPQKDTPPESKNKTLTLDRQVEWASEQSLETHDVAQQRPAENSGAVRIPYFMTSTDLIPAIGGLSPTKYRPYDAEEYAALIEGRPIVSAHAEFDRCDDAQHGGNSSAPLEGERREPLIDRDRAGRFSEETRQNASKRLWKRQSSAVGIMLPPTFYSPKDYPTSLWEASGVRPSHNTDRTRYHFVISPHAKADSASNYSTGEPAPSFFNGEFYGIDPSPRTGTIVHGAMQDLTPQKPIARAVNTMTVRELEDREQHVAVRQQGSCDLLHPEQSSSKLTDMLNGVSPSKADGYAEEYPNCPSAVPSPLHRGSPAYHGPSSYPGPHYPNPWILPDGSDLLWQFIKLNEHIDVLGTSVYDTVERIRRSEVEAISSKYDKQISMLNEGFEAVKSSIVKLEEKVDGAADQSHMINATLDKLLDFVKTEVAHPMAAQAVKVAEMGNDIKMLQKTVADLQKGIGPSSRSSPHGGPPAAHGGLPFHRSQPSLTNHFGQLAIDSANNDSTRNLPPSHGPDPRNNTSRYNNPSWYRPSFGNGDNRDENHAFPNTNHYIPGGYGYGNANYHFPGPPVQGFGYGPSVPK